ncbi:MAG: ATP-binding cassette domain-containing protein [Chthoniobacteraceae bacterium]
MELHLENLTKQYGTHRVLDGVSLHLEKAQSLVLIGPSGGGKSTLLRILAGLVIPEAGTVEIDGTRLGAEEKKRRDWRRNLGVVFQAYNLFPHLTALQNVMLPLEKVHGLGRAAARRRRGRRWSGSSWRSMRTRSRGR